VYIRNFREAIDHLLIIENGVDYGKAYFVVERLKSDFLSPVNSLLNEVRKLFNDFVSSGSFSGFDLKGVIGGSAWSSLVKGIGKVTRHLDRAQKIFDEISTRSVGRSIYGRIKFVYQCPLVT